MWLLTLHQLLLLIWAMTTTFVTASWDKWWTYDGVSGQSLFSPNLSYLTVCRLLRPSLVPLRVRAFRRFRSAGKRKRGSERRLSRSKVRFIIFWLSRSLKNVSHVLHRLFFFFVLSALPSCSCPVAAAAGVYRSRVLFVISGTRPDCRLFVLPACLSPFFRTNVCAEATLLCHRFSRSDHWDSDVMQSAGEKEKRQPVRPSGTRGTDVCGCSEKIKPSHGSRVC